MMSLNKRLLIIFGIVLLFVVIILVTIFRTNQSIKPTPSPSANPFINQPIDDQNTVLAPTVSEITPEEGTILNPGTVQDISIKFNQPLEADSIYINLKAADIGGDNQYKEVAFNQEFNKENTLLKLTTTEPILSFHNYNLAIFTKTGEKLLQVTYVSDRTEIIKESLNNNELIQYLPYETPSFTLSFVPDKNIYVFSFNFNAETDESIDVQYDKAKLEAEDYIRGRGIDPNSLKIEWRYH